MQNVRLHCRNILTRIEADCTFRISFSSLMNNTSCKKQSNLFSHFYRTPKPLSRSSWTLSCLCLQCLYKEDDRCLCSSTRTFKCPRVQPTRSTPLQRTAMMLGTKNTKKKFLVIIISRNQCNKHHTRDFQILTQPIVFPAESTRPIYSGLFYCYCDIWHCGPYCTVPYIVPCLHCATFQRHTVMHKRLKLRGPYFLCKMPSILSVWLYFKGFF